MVMTGDQAAVAILLGKGTAEQKHARLTVLANKLRAVWEGRETCPDCGDEGPHDCNQDGSELCCAGCGMQFEASREVTL